MTSLLRDNPILWHFPPWKSRGARGRLFWLFLLLGLALPIAVGWAIHAGGVFDFLDPSIMTERTDTGLYRNLSEMEVGERKSFPVVSSWAWWTILVGVTLMSWLLVLPAMYQLRLNLLRMGLLEQVYLTGIERNRAAMGSVAWGAMVGLIIIMVAFAFQVICMGFLYPVALGRLINLQWINGMRRSQPMLETIPFGVGYACVLLAASLAVWSRALRGALRQASAPWIDAPRCIAAGVIVFSIILSGIVMLGTLPQSTWYGIIHDSFTFSMIALSASVIVAIFLVQIRSVSRIAGRICFGPLNPELFERDDWWESEHAHRRNRIALPRHSPSDWGGQIVVSLAGVSLALYILSLVARSIDLREMTVQFPYVVALLGIYAPAGIAVFEIIRGPLGNHRPVRGRLIRSVLHGALPIMISVAIGLAFFLWIAAGLNNSIRDDMDDLVPWVTVAFGIGFGLFAHILLLPRKGRTSLLIGAAVAAVVMLATPLAIGGIALFGVGLAALCSLPSGLMSVLFQRIHDDLPQQDVPFLETHLETPEPDVTVGERMPPAASAPSAGNNLSDGTV